MITPPRVPATTGINGNGEEDGAVGQNVYIQEKMEEEMQRCISIVISMYQRVCLYYESIPVLCEMTICWCNAQ